MATYIFDHWEVNGSPVGSNNPMTVTITAETTITAVYVPVAVTHQVTLTSNPTSVPYTQPPGTAPFIVTVDDGASISVQVPNEVEA